MSHEGDGPADVYRAEPRKAVKPHKCSACRESIAVGSAYMSVFIVFEGETYNIRRCARCEAIHAHLRTLCRESLDDRWPDDELNCGEDYADNWGREPPPEIAALAFSLPGEIALARGERKEGGG